MNLYCAFSSFNISRILLAFPFPIPFTFTRSFSEALNIFSRDPKLRSNKITERQGFSVILCCKNAAEVPDAAPTVTQNPGHQLSSYISLPFIFFSLRRGRDSNPGYSFEVHPLSRRTDSATLAPLQILLEFVKKTSS